MDALSNKIDREREREITSDELTGNVIHGQTVSKVSFPLLTMSRDITVPLPTFCSISSLKK